MRLIKYICVLLIFTSCSSNDDDLEKANSLASYLSDKIIENGAVIACAGSDLNTDDILVFYYPEVGASDIRLYLTADIELDKNEFVNYSRLEIDRLPFFNGYLEKVIVDSEIEKWIIVTYELNNEIKISNPIRTKQIVKPTVWSEEVNIDMQQLGMPIFSWINNQFEDNAIYFQVVSNTDDDLLSGTYTFENKFQYYNTSNVVLNITLETPPILTVGERYNFTLMDVSEDNWVNTIIQKNFEIQ